MDLIYFIYNIHDLLGTTETTSPLSFNTTLTSFPSYYHRPGLFPGFLVACLIVSSTTLGVTPRGSTFFNSSIYSFDPNV